MQTVPYSARDCGLDNDLAWKIFLDRYTCKDLQRRFEVGDVAIVQTNDDPKWPRKEVARVEQVAGERLTLTLLTGEAAGDRLEAGRVRCDRPLERTVREVAERVAAAIAEAEPANRGQHAAAFAEEISALRLVPGGRVWAGAGSGVPLTLFNCYVVPNPRDSRQGIIETLGQMIEIMARGGGVGINVSSLRPYRAPVRGVNGRSSGAVSWMDLYSRATGLVEQGGSRRGALMLQLEIWHPDVWRFIDVKKAAGMVENANISLRVSDAFMEAVEGDGPWELVFPDTEDPAYDTLWNGDLAAWRAAGHRVVVYETVPARRLWAAATDSAWQCAEPGVVFSDRHETDSNSWYFNPLVCTNPCVAGDALVHTSGGLRRAAELWASQDPPEVLTDGRFHAPAFSAASAVFRTGFKPIVRIQTREGYELRVTPDHRLFSEERGWVPAAELRSGEALRVANRGGGFGSTGTREEGRVLGWLVGDAHFTSERAVLSFYGEERAELAAAFASAVNTVIRPGRSRPYAPVGVVDVPARGAATIASARLREFALARGVTTTSRPRLPEVVWTGSRDLQAGFLQALFEADGYVETERGARPGLRLSAAVAELLIDVQRLLLNFGVFSRLQRERSPLTGGGHRSVRLHVRTPRYQLVICGASVGRFAEELGFLGERKRGELEAYLRSYARGPYRERFLAHVEAVVEDGAEWVYDLTEPATHSFVANGFVVHNCAEQPLPAWGVCTLGHVNLGRMATADGRDVDWEGLSRTVRRGVRFLDDVVSATPYFFSENQANQMNERRVGLGTLGLADLMIRLGHRYGAPESEPFLHHLFSFIRDEAYLASVELATEQGKGPFPAFDAERYLQSGFCKRLPDGVREQIRRHGIRNVTLLTQAPTGTVGTMVNTSTGIEPYYSFKFTRQSRLGLDEQWVPLAEEWLQAHAGSELPACFVSAMDLTPEEHIRVQAVVQRYTDSSISKTANAPHGYTKEQTSELYRLAYATGCKGVTIYRDGSRYEQVLHDVSTGAAPAEGEAAPAPAAALPVAPVPRPRPDVIRGQTVRMAAPEGTVYITLNEHPDGKPFEVFARAGKAGSDLTASVDAIARLASLALRSGIAPAAIVDQLEGIGGRNSVGFGPRRVRSVADAIAKAMQLVWLGGPHTNGHSAAERGAEAPAGPAADPQTGRRGDLCPACGEYALLYQEGCVTCSSCGHSEC